MRQINHITQSEWNSCASSCVAMLLGHKSDRTVWDEWGREYAENTHKIGIKEYLKNKGLELSCYDSDIVRVQSLELGHVHLVSIPSINIDGGMHYVIWDGRAYEGNKYIYDPAEGREGRRHYIANFEGYKPNEKEVVINSFFVDCEVIGGSLIGKYCDKI